MVRSVRQTWKFVLAIALLYQNVAQGEPVPVEDQLLWLYLEVVAHKKWRRKQMLPAHRRRTLLYTLTLILYHRMQGRLLLRIQRPKTALTLGNW
uniref:Putative secreted protein n=1 Tax=Panstrongylus lignarius TaxID=156445 RepID=A0A224XRF0_9HEMI